jgi:hypothetical protein
MAVIRTCCAPSAVPTSSSSNDWGLAPLDAGARHNLLEILEDRYGRRSIISPANFRSTQ